LRWPEPEGPTFLLDPCAGEGTAIRTLRRLWLESYCPEPFRPAGGWYNPLSILACELEAERAATLQGNLDPAADAAYHGDAFRLSRTSLPDTGATVLYLNPPYDQDPEYGRLEHRFLVRFAHHLHPGAGFLFYLVPYSALEPSAEFLARHFLDLRAWRLPEPEFSCFHQVLLVGRRARRPLDSAAFAPQILAWAEDAGSLPVLPERCPDPYVVPPSPETGYSLAYDLAPYDLTAAVLGFRPWLDAPVGTSLSARELLGARFETAMPPKPVHIALALSSGMFNGHLLKPNDPRRHPPLLAKGVFERELVPISERHNREGDVVATVEIERPRLALTVLRLDDSSFHRLAAGTVPAGGDDVALWNAADLIANYDRSLARLLAQQFPALHDPHRDEHRIALPTLARKPFEAQAHAVQAALKLLGRSVNPFLVAEVGTGKCTMALAIAAALLPAHHATTTAEMRRLGLPDRLPRVEKILIVSPPHLLKTWSDQAAAVVPELSVQIVESAADLARPARIFLLSREAAKLGHGYRGVEGRCPRCGAILETTASANATRRLRCAALSRRPVDRAARLATDLALLLAPSCPKDPLVAELVTAPALRRRLDQPARPLPTARLVDLHDRLLREIIALYRAEGEEDHAILLPLTKLLVRFDLALGTGSRALPVLWDLTWGPASSTWGPYAWVRSVIARLKDRQAVPPLALPAEQARELLGVLETLHSLATWEERGPCGEPLYQATPKPRRYPLARLIRRRHARDFSLLVLDEAHELNQPGSAQSKAAHRLSGLPGVPTIVLTGSLMGGYASSLFTNFWALSPAFRAEFGRDDRAAFIARYGFRKVLVSHDGPRRLGAHTDREIGARTTIGEAPGLLPNFILRHLLPVATLVHKSDLDVELPPLLELPAPIAAPEDDPLARALLAEYERLQEKLLSRIRADRFDRERAGRLLGALVELPSYLDRATDDLPPFEIRDPEELGGGLLATGRSFPADWRTPKETWLLERVRKAIGRSEKVLVFLRHTGTPELPARLLRLLGQVTPQAAWLDAGKVPTARREAWIDQHVLARDVQVLLVNPNAVRTGLNNLVSFSVGLWYELDLSTTTYRQANGRLHRIGQTREVAIETPYYQGTAQQVTFELIARKTTASLQVDGLNLQAALEAAGASDEETSALSTALSLGQAVYRALAGR
jgi:uncharacterized methyltransferase DUF6094